MVKQKDVSRIIDDIRFVLFYVILESINGNKYVSFYGEVSFSGSKAICENMQNQLEEDLSNDENEEETLLQTSKRRRKPTKKAVSVYLNLCMCIQSQIKSATVIP